MCASKGPPTVMIICLLFPSLKNSRVYHRLLDFSKEDRHDDEDELIHSELSLRVALGTTRYRQLPGTVHVVLLECERSLHV